MCREVSTMTAALVVWPASEVHAHGAPICARGAGTSLAGQTTNAAVIVDTSRHMREILEVDPGQRLARVQPGVVRDQLAKPLEREHNLSFPPDTSTHAYATFGGMIANNSCGAHSVMTGRTSDNLEELEVVLYDGTRMRVGATSDEDFERIVGRPGRRAQIYSALRDFRDRHGDLVRERYPDMPRRVSGYNLDDLLPEKGFHVARALAGSEGTLALILEATVRLTPWPPARSLVVLGYPSIFEAADHIPEIMSHEPMACEAIDDVLVDDMVKQGLYQSELPMLPDGKGFLLVEFGGDTREESDARVQEFVRAVKGGAAEVKVYEDEDEEEKLWQVREGGLGATAYLPGGRDHFEGWEDAAVPPENLGAYLRDFQDLLDRYGYDTSKYGHMGQGLVHCRINFGLKFAGGVRHFRDFLTEAGELVHRHGGLPSGEHGDGQSKAVLLEEVYGPELVQAFREYKAIWDPDFKLNPGKLVEPNDPTDDLKLGSDYDPPQPQTHFWFPEDGGSFAHATLRCVGAGKCRDTSEGTMCPSFMATLDEEHTTRGRARILFEMLRGETITDGWRSEAVYDALDLCLSCKGCKGDCPVDVDMATYKAEFLAHHFKRRLRPRPAYSMGLIMFHARLAARVPRLANLVAPLGRKPAGLTTERPMPKFAGETLQSWYAQRGGPRVEGPQAVLFADTFTNHFAPEIGRAAVDVLESAGKRVLMPQGFLCCGRPLYDYGMLPTAKALWRKTLRALRRPIRDGIHVVVLEPSCAAAFRDELPNLFPHDEDAKRLSLQTLTLAEYLRREAPDWEPRPVRGEVMLHGHCHQKAVIGMDAEMELLQSAGASCDGELGAGCCGLAGSFGFEAEKHDLSMKIGERKLFPAVRDAELGTTLIADGFSCRKQIVDGTGRRALHLAEVLAPP